MLLERVVRLTRIARLVFLVAGIAIFLWKGGTLVRQGQEVSPTVVVDLLLFAFIIPLSIWLGTRWVEQMVEGQLSGEGSRSVGPRPPHQPGTEGGGMGGEVHRQTERVESLGEISLAITSTLDLQTILQLLLEKVELNLGFPAASVRLLNDDTGALEPVACRNLDEGEWKKRRATVQDEVAKTLIEKKAALAIANLQTDPRIHSPEFFRRQGLVSCLWLPLIARGEVLGVLSLYTKEENLFSNDQVDFLSRVAAQAAMAIVNARRYAQAKVEGAVPAQLTSPDTQLMNVLLREVRTPLTSIMGYAEIMKDKILGQVNPRQDEALEQVLRSSREILNLIDGIFNVKKVEVLKEEVLQSSRPLAEAVADFERDLILKALQTTGFNQTKAASLLGTTRRILGYRMEKLKIGREGIEAEGKEEQ